MGGSGTLCISNKAPGRLRQLDHSAGRKALVFPTPSSSASLSGFQKMNAQTSPQPVFRVHRGTHALATVVLTTVAANPFKWVDCHMQF